MVRLKNKGIVKVFFSSPFGGMEEEREELTRRYFPQVRHLCNTHGLQFAAVDMRWGITSESSSNAQVINICLREIDRSDVFIGFFGQAAKTMFEIIMKYLKNILLVDLETQKKTKREELISQHDAFLTSRCNIFVNKEKYMKLLDCQPMLISSTCILVTGEPGSGKSAVLCNWIASLKQEKSSHALAYHFVGFAEKSTDINKILGRLADEFEYVLYQDEKPIQEGVETPEEGSIDETKYFIHKLLSAMEKVAHTGKTPVLVIDGLDKVSNVSKIGKVLYWLPEVFPMGCIIAVSTLSTDLTNIEELTRRNYKIINVEPLPVEAKRDMCVQLLQESGKELSSHQLDKIVSAEMTKTPIFLGVTMSELVSFGYFRLLDKKIDDLISCGSVAELFSKVLSRLEEDYNVPGYTENLVEQVMCSIYLSRQGLKELEIQEIFNIPDHIWSPLYFAVEKLTIDQSGCIQFGFHELKDACSIKYLSNPENKNVYLLQLINFFKKEISKMDKFPEALEVCPRPILELPWLLADLEDFNGLADCLSNFHVFANLQRHSPYDLVSLWRLTGYPGQKMTNRLLLTFDKAISVLYTEAEENGLLKTSTPPGLEIDWFLRAVDDFLDEAGFKDCREPVIQRNINLLTEILELPRCQSNQTAIRGQLRQLKHKLASVYSQSDKTAEKGIQLHQELLNIYIWHGEKHGSSDELLKHIGTGYQSIGVAYINIRDYNKMIQYTEKAEECFKQMEKPALTQFASVWNNLGIGHMNVGNLERAMEYFDKSVQAYEESHFGETPPVIGEIINNKAICLRKLERLEEAEEMYRKSLEVKQKAFGEEHQIVAMSYMNLGSLEMYRKNLSKSKEHIEKAREIYEVLDQTWNNPEYIMCWENILACLTDMQRFEEADEHIMKLLEWRLENNSMEICLSTLYREMLVYYVRERVHYDRAVTMAKALLSSVRKDDLQVYAYLDMALQNLPEEYTKNVPEEMTVKYIVEKHPDRIDMLGYYAKTHLVPAGNIDELAVCLNRLHDVFDGVKDSVYFLCHSWFPSNDVMHLQCQQRSLEEGLRHYPDNLDMCLALAKCFKIQEKPDLALPYFIQVTDQQMDNFVLVYVTAETAILANDLDTGRHYAHHIVETCTDESLKSKAQALLGLLDDHTKSENQEENQDHTDNNS